MNVSSKQLIDQAFSQGRTYYSPLFRAKFFASDTTFHTVVITKKQLPHAVDRNRVRRRITHALKSFSLPLGTLVILASKDILTVPYKQLLSELDKCLSQFQS